MNKCWACRVGYQVLFIDGVSLASDAYLDTGVDSRSMIFHGWHVGHRMPAVGVTSRESDFASQPHVRVLLDADIVYCVRSVTV